MSSIKSIGMAEARPKLTQLVEEVYAGGEPYLIISGSRVKAVIIGGVRQALSVRQTTSAFG